MSVCSFKKKNFFHLFFLSFSTFISIALSRQPSQVSLANMAFSSSSSIFFIECYGGECQLCMERRIYRLLYSLSLSLSLSLSRSLSPQCVVCTSKRRWLQSHHHSLVVCWHRHTYTYTQTLIQTHRHTHIHTLRERQTHTVPQYTHMFFTYLPTSPFSLVFVFHGLLLFCVKCMHLFFFFFTSKKIHLVR